MFLLMRMQVLFHFFFLTFHLLSIPPTSSSSCWLGFSSVAKFWKVWASWVLVRRGPKWAQGRGQGDSALGSGETKRMVGMTTGTWATFVGLWCGCV